MVLSSTFSSSQKVFSRIHISLILIVQETGTKPKSHKLQFYWYPMARTRIPQCNNLSTLLPSSNIALLFCGPPKFCFSIYSKRWPNWVMLKWNLEAHKTITQYPRRVKGCSSCFVGDPSLPWGIDKIAAYDFWALYQSPIQRVLTMWIIFILQWNVKGWLYILSVSKEMHHEFIGLPCDLGSRSIWDKSQKTPLHIVTKSTGKMDYSSPIVTLMVHFFWDWVYNILQFGEIRA